MVRHNIYDTSQYLCLMGHASYISMVYYWFLLHFGNQLETFEQFLAGLISMIHLKHLYGPRRLAGDIC